jgi:ribosomal protein S18 acetylase RimI-like enzyme
VTTRLRPISADDLPLLREIYASTREDELSVVPWSQEQKAAFLRMQFEAQHAHYQKFYPDAQFLLVLVDDVPAGRLYVHRGPSELRLIDIALLPGFRGKGLGAALLRELLEEARGSGRAVTIHVERNNRALHLYERLGFRTVTDDGGLYLLLRWSA